MNKEKIFLSIFATVAGLLVAGIAFYFYEGAKTIPQ
jgi:biopolymer transport protein ExbB/TolQ